MEIYLYGDLFKFRSLHVSQGSVKRVRLFRSYARRAARYTTSSPGAPPPPRMWLAGTAGWRAPLVTALLALGLVASAAVDAVLGTRLAKQLDLYIFPTMQLLYPASFVLVGLPVLAVLWWTGRAVGTPTPLRRVARVVAVIAVWDSLSSLLVLAPALYLPSDLLLLLGQAGLPFTLLVSAAYLKTRYRTVHVLAVATVLAGVAVDLLPALVRSAADAEHADKAAVGTPLVVGAVVLALLAHGPMAASRVYQDHWLKAYDLHPWAVVAAVAPVQLLLSVGLLAGVALAPLPHPAPALAPADFGPYVANATRCVLGRVATLPPVGTARATASGAADVACGGVGAVFLAHLLVNMLYNLLAVTVIKRVSANLGVLLNVLRIGGSAVLYAWPLVAGAAYDPVTPTAVLALVVVALGVATYRTAPEQRPAAAAVAASDAEIPLADLRACADDEDDDRSSRSGDAALIDLHLDSSSSSNSAGAGGDLEAAAARLGFPAVPSGSARV